MQYINTKNPSAAANKLSELILTELRTDKSVLWLICGGSSIDVATQASRSLANQPKLKVMQVDERFGPVGHPHSNWQQMLDKGFKQSAFDCQPILTGTTLEITAEDYEARLKQAMGEANIRIGLFGIGADGHTAGIMPDSPACTSDKLVVGYRAVDYERITITPKAIAMMDRGVVYAMGPDKYPTLSRLKQYGLIDKQPAQALKAIGELYVYTDYEG